MAEAEASGRIQDGKAAAATGGGEVPATAVGFGGGRHTFRGAGGGARCACLGRRLGMRLDWRLRPGRNWLDVRSDERQA